MRIFVVLGLCASLAPPVIAQTATFVGTVARDSVGTAVGQAQVQLPQLNRTTTTNYLGEFQFTNLPAGRFAVTVRAVGFQPFIDSVDIKAGGRIDGDIVLTAMPVNLAAQRTTAAAIEKPLPPGIREMEERRKTHLGGYYVTDSLLRTHDDRKLTYFLSQVPRIQQVLSQMGPGVFLASGGPAPLFKTDGTFPVFKCYIDVFLNGGKFFAGPPSPVNPPPDFSTFWAREYSGIEYYPNGSSTPAEYNGTGGGCGVLLLWTRR